MFNDKAGQVSLKTEQAAQSKVQGDQGSQVPRRDTKHCHQNEVLRYLRCICFSALSLVNKLCATPPRSDSCRQTAHHSQPRQHPGFQDRLPVLEPHGPTAHHSQPQRLKPNCILLLGIYEMWIQNGRGPTLKQAAGSKRPEAYTMSEFRIQHCPPFHKEKNPDSTPRHDCLNQLATLLVDSFKSPLLTAMPFMVQRPACVCRHVETVVIAK